VLLDEAQQRRERLLEELQAARTAGDLGRYRELVREWRRFPRVYGEGPPPV